MTDKKQAIIEQAIELFRKEHCLPVETLGGKLIGYRMYEDVEDAKELEEFLRSQLSQAIEEGRRLEREERANQEG